MKQLILCLSLSISTFVLFSQSSSLLKADELNMYGTNGAQTVRLIADQGSGNNYYGQFLLARTTSSISTATKVGLSADVNDGGYLYLFDALGTTGARLYGDYLSSTATSSNHGHLYLRGSSIAPPTTSGPVLDLIRLANGGKSQEWDIGIYNAKAQGQDRGTYIAFQYENSTKAILTTDGNLLQISDGRFKKNIQGINGATKKLLNTKPSIYEMKSTPGVKQYGFIAQNLKENFPELVTHILNKEEDHYVVNYTGMIPILTQAIQEQQVLLERKNNTIKVLDERVAELENKISKVENLETILEKTELLAAKLEKVAIMEEQLYQIEQGLQACCLNAKVKHHTNELNNKLIDAPYLEQNSPNPFFNQTTISYYLPPSAKQASLVLTNLKGEILKRFTLPDTGQGSVDIDGGSLAIGMYHYSLFVDGKVVKTNRMVLTK